MENTKEIKKVVIRAPLLTKSGYGVHSRQIAKWLFDREDSVGDIKVYCQPVPWGITPWIVDSEFDDGLIGRIVQCSQPVEETFDVSYQVQLPNEWNPFLANKNIGVTAAVETDKCNPQWVDACNKMDAIIVPSEFTKSTLKNSGEIKVPLVVIPESYPEIFDEEPTSDSSVDGLDLQTDFNFLIFGQITGNNPENDRKNLPYTIKWLCELFHDNPNIGIIIKTNCGRLTEVDRINTFNLIAQLVAQVKSGVGPKIYLLHGDMSEKELYGLYTNPKIKALISLHHSEGFGLSLLEAARCELPVIATNWSAPIEFLNLDKFVKVDYELQNIHPSRVDGNIWIEGTKWAQPIEQDAKRKIKKFVENSSIPKEWAKALAPKIKEKYSLSAIFEHYTKFYEETVLK